MTFIMVVEPQKEPQKESQVNKGPDLVAELKLQIKSVADSVEKIGRDLSRLNTTLTTRLSQLDGRVKALDNRIKVLAEPVEEEPAENTGDRKLEASEAPEAE